MSHQTETIYTVVLEIPHETYGAEIGGKYVLGKYQEDGRYQAFMQAAALSWQWPTGTWVIVCEAGEPIHRFGGHTSMPAWDLEVFYRQHAADKIGEPAGSETGDIREPLDESFSCYSVSHATLRAIDLFTAYGDFLREHRPELLEEIGFPTYAWDNLEISDDRGTENRVSLGAFRLSEDDLYYLVNEDLWEAMNDISPNGHYFGSHPGDGADMGFWPYEDSPSWD